VKNVTVTRRKGPYELSLEGTIEELPELIKTLDSLEIGLKTDEQVHEIVPLEPMANEETPSLAGSSSASEAVLKLFNTNWGVKPKTIRQIKTVLDTNALFYPVTTLSGILTDLARHGKLRRWKTPEGYVYVRGKIE
jgi:hypothetical protein